MLDSGQSESIAVLGLGYVGCVTAACLAKLGHRVYGIDKDAIKVDSILAAKAPFYEPGLEDVIRETVAAGRLSAAEHPGRIGCPYRKRARRAVAACSSSSALG